MNRRELWTQKLPDYYWKQCPDSYPMELAAMYRDLILGYMERQMGREHYQSACRYIRRMIKLGARLMAVGLIERLRKLYPARRAMLEELAKI